MKTNIEKNVMRRVHMINVIRPLISNGAIAFVVFVVAMWGIGREVWVARVFQNMSQTGSVASALHFWLAAFTHTRFSVQALALVSFTAVVYLARETAKLVTETFTLVRA